MECGAQDGTGRLPCGALLYVHQTCYGGMVLVRRHRAAFGDDHGKKRPFQRADPASDRICPVSAGGGFGAFAAEKENVKEIADLAAGFWVEKGYMDNPDLSGFFPMIK